MYIYIYTYIYTYIYSIYISYGYNIYIKYLYAYVCLVCSVSPYLDLSVDPTYLNPDARLE